MNILVKAGAVNQKELGFVDTVIKIAEHAENY